MAWFICENEKVTGPFSSDDVKAQATSGSINMDCLVWGRQQSSWKTLNQWLKELPQLSQTFEDPQDQQMWHYAIQGDAKGPITRKELIHELKGQRTKDEILLWTKGMKAWADLFEFHDILDDLGMNKREHERALIQGSVVLKIENVDVLGTLQTISAGGFGAVDLKSSLGIGQTVGVVIASEKLNTKINAKATVQYISDRGFYGFKFQGLNMEARTIIIEYIRRSKIVQDNAA